MAWEGRYVHVFFLRQFDTLVNQGSRRLFGLLEELGFQVTLKLFIGSEN